MLQLKAGDIVLFHGNNLISKLIRLFSTTLFERRTKVNHVGIIVADGDIRSAILVEALSHVKRHTIAQGYNASYGKVTIYRPIGLSKSSIERICERAESYVGRDYGYLKIVAHFLDWCLFGAYVFRRLTADDKYPICSWLVAAAYASIRQTFGTTVGQAEPDDIYDYCLATPNKFEKVIGLTPISELLAVSEVR